MASAEDKHASSAATTDGHAGGAENGHHFAQLNPASSNPSLDSNLNSMPKEPNVVRHLTNVPVYTPKYAEGIVKLSDREYHHQRPETTGARSKESVTESKNRDGPSGSNGTAQSDNFSKPGQTGQNKAKSNGGGKQSESGNFVNGKSAKNGRTSMTPPQSRVKNANKAVSSPQEGRHKGTTPQSKSRPSPQNAVAYQKGRYPPVQQAGGNVTTTYTSHQGGYSAQPGYVVRSSTASNHVYTVQQRGPTTVRQPVSTSGKPQVIIQPPSAGSCQQQQHFIIQTPQDQYPHRPSPAQRPYVQTSTGPPVSVAGQPHQQQVVIQFHHQAPPDNQPVGQRLVIHPQQLVERRIVTSSGYPTSSIPISQPHTSQQGPSQPPPEPSPDRSPLVQSRVVKQVPQQPKVQPARPEEIMLHEMSTHPDLPPLPDAFHTVLDQIHASGVPPKEMYKKLKKHFKYLIYENECYQEELRSSQRKLLKLSRDKNFLLDRLMHHEQADSDDQAAVGEESEADSDATVDERPKPKKKKVAKKRPMPGSQPGPMSKKSKENGDEFSEDGDSKPASQVQNSPTPGQRTDFSHLRMQQPEPVQAQRGRADPHS